MANIFTGIRLISSLQGATDADEAEALSWKNDVIDIYSNSWGPSDSGIVIAGPGHLTHRALQQGVETVRIMDCAGQKC